MRGCSEQTQQIAEQQKSAFNKKTEQVFNDKFKGFEYSVGDKQYRFNVKNTEQVKQAQSDINNFVGKFLNEENTMEDAKGYHKSLYTAMHADAVAQHFYEQGKADAIRESVANAKNLFPVLKTLVVPILPEPTVLISFFRKILVINNPNGIDPRK